jgi:hypothetical protein
VIKNKKVTEGRKKKKKNFPVWKCFSVCVCMKRPTIKKGDFLNLGSDGGKKKSFTKRKVPREEIQNTQSRSFSFLFSPPKKTNRKTKQKQINKTR